MDLTTALRKAEHVKTALAPFCERIVIAGSIRRLKHEVKDVEIVCIPAQAGDGLFADIPRHCPPFGEALHRLGRVTSGSVLDGKHIKLTLPDGVKVDVFTTTEDSWGWTLTLRTGSREHNMRLIARLKGNGYVCDEGAILWKGTARRVPDETTAFRMAGAPFVQPQFRV